MKDVLRLYAVQHSVSQSFQWQCTEVTEVTEFGSAFPSSLPNSPAFSDFSHPPVLIQKGPAKQSNIEG